MPQHRMFADENGEWDGFFEVSANVELAVTNMVARIWRIMIKPSVMMTI